MASPKTRSQFFNNRIFGSESKLAPAFAIEESSRDIASAHLIEMNASESHRSNDDLSIDMKLIERHKQL